MSSKADFTAPTKSSLAKIQNSASRERGDQVQRSPAKIATRTETLHTHIPQANQQIQQADIPSDSQESHYEQSELHTQTEESDISTSLTHSELERAGRPQATLSLDTTAVDNTRGSSRMAPPRGKVDLKWSGLYDGTQPANRWLDRLDYDLQELDDPETGHPPPKRWIMSFSMLLEGKAAKWADRKKDIRQLIEKKAPTWNDAEYLREAIQREFPGDDVEEISVSVDLEIATLRQEKGETLMQYYQRGLQLLRDAGGREIAPDDDTASLLERTQLRTLGRNWANGLIDPEVADMCIPALTQETYSLASLYRAAREATQTQIYRKEKREAEDQKKKFELYERLVKEQYAPQQLTAMMAACHVQQNNNTPSWPPVQHSVYPQRNAPYNHANTQHYGRGYNNFGYGRSDNHQQKSGDVRNNGHVAEGINNLEKHSSGNPFVNGQRTYNPDLGVLCVSCGELGHMRMNCTGIPLRYEEQDILKQMVFGNNYRPPPARRGNQQVKFVPSSAPFQAGSSSGTNQQKGTEQTGHSVTASFRDGNLDYHDMPYSHQIIGEAHPNNAKRVRTQPPIETEPSPQEPEISYAPQPLRRPKKKSAGLAPLHAMIDEKTGSVEKPISMKELFNQTNVTLKLSHFLQWSPQASAEARRLVTRKGTSKRVQRPKRKATDALGDDTEGNAEATVNQSGGTMKERLNEFKCNATLLAKIRAEHRAFRIPVTLRHRVEGYVQELKLDNTATHADAGSDLNCLAESAARQWKMKMIPLKELGLEGLVMSTASYGTVDLKYYVEIDVGVEGVWRTIQAVVVPEAREGHSHHRTHQLLLGLPWLYDVDAVLGVKEAKIWLGDSDMPEDRKAIVGAEQVFSGEQRIMLCPKMLMPRNESDNDTESGESESEYETESDESHQDFQ